MKKSRIGSKEYLKEQQDLTNKINSSKLKSLQRKTTQSNEAKQFNQSNKIIQNKPVNLEEIENLEDRDIIKSLNTANLQQNDINKINKIHNSAIRSRLQHEWNLQSSNFYKNVKAVNQVTNDDLINNAYDTVLNLGSEIPVFGKAVGGTKALMGTISAPKSKSKEYFNKNYSDLLEQYPELQDGSYNPDLNMTGSGLISDAVNYVKNKFSKKQDFNNISTSTLKKYGNYKVRSISVAKQPVAGILDTVINFISLGKWSELKKKYGFDQLFHLGLLINLDINGQNKMIQCEKIDAVTITDKITLATKKAKHTSVNINISITLNELINKALMTVGKEKFFDYSALGIGNQPPNNCQYFAKYILEAGQAYTTGIKEFVFQDVEALALEFPEYAKYIVNLATDAGQIANNVRGANLKKLTKIKL